MKYKFSKEVLESAVRESESISSVCRILNIRPTGGNYKTINRKIRLWNIDTSHFKGRAWNLGLTFESKLKIPLNEILIENSTYVSTDRLRRRLIKEGIKKYECECCGLFEWNGKEIPLELNHINGINTDNRIENLEIICPNCHAQTPNFRGKNSNNARADLKNKLYIKNKDIPRIRKSIKFCVICNIETKNIYCSIDCYRIGQSKNIPTKDDLLNTIHTEKSVSAVGRRYNVSDNAVRKWCKKYDINIKEYLNKYN
jgi:Zn finger protein HypA/HybF involved in hydrogenase expression